MGSYLINFSVYTTAMIGVIFLALFAVKKCSNLSFSKQVSGLSVEDSMKLSVRKTLYVIKANNEKFLIAADTDKTTLIAKLEDGQEVCVSPVREELAREDHSKKLMSFDGIESIGEFSSVIDLDKKRTKKGPMMKELAKKLRS